MNITTAEALRGAHLALQHRALVGLAPGERQLLTDHAAGLVHLATLAELGAFFGVSQSAFKRWARWDDDDVLAKPPYNVLAVEAVRARMVRGAARVQLRQPDLWPSLRKREGFGGV